MHATGAVFRNPVGPDTVYEAIIAEFKAGEDSSCNIMVIRNAFTGQRWGRRLFADYGMVFVLLLLMITFSLLTLTRQSSTGVDAGRDVAARIIRQYGTTARILIAVPFGEQNRKFAAGAEEVFGTAGVKLAGTVIGTPADARAMLERLAKTGELPDAVAVTDKSSQWAVFGRYPQLSPDRLVEPSQSPWPVFLKAENLLGVASQTAIYAIIAVGMTMVIIIREIDLSVGSVLALASVTATAFIRDFGGGSTASLAAICAGCFLALGVTSLAGALNGVMLTVARLPSFIVTLAMMLIARGLAQRISAQQSIGDIPAAFRWLGGGSLGGIPNPVWLMLMFYAIAHFVMGRTVFGRVLYAIGGNPEAARLCGIRVQWWRFLVFTLSGALSGLGGILLSSRLNAGDPKYGEMYELEVIAAVVVGGTSLMGGEGRMFGTLIGAFIIAVIRNGMNLLGVESSSQSIVLGSVLLLAVLADQIKRRWQPA